jgi:capsular exopolysaccharide synthesis family protein
MELRQYLSIFTKWLWLIALSVLIAAGASYLASKAATPLYRTKTTLMVGRVVQNPDPNSADIYTGQQLATIYSQLVRREPVLDGAINTLGLDIGWQALANQVSSSVIPQTQLLEIAVMDSDPYRAKVIADTLAQQLILQSPAAANTASDEIEFIQVQMDDLKAKINDGRDEIVRLQQELDAANSAQQIQELQNQINILETKINDWQQTYSQLITTIQGGDVNVLSIVEEATVPTFPVSPNTRTNVLLAAMIGLILAVGGVILIEYLDDTVKTIYDVEKATKLPTIGTIPKINGGGYPGKLITFTEPLAPIAEAFRSLRTNILYSSVDKPLQSIQVTSPGPGEGKSICVANLAVVMAQSGMNVILVDADLRRPVQHEIFSLNNISGLSDAIVQNHKTSVAEFIQLTEVENLRILSSGTLPANPAKLLGSEAMKHIVQELRGQADIVLYDSPPVGVVADSLSLCMILDGVLVVCDVGRTRMGELKQSIVSFERLHANLIGVVLNRHPGGKGSYYYYYYQNGQKTKRRQESVENETEDNHKSHQTLGELWKTKVLRISDRSD